MRRNGYYTLYDLWSEKRWVADHIDHSLQDRICKVVEGHANVYDYERCERMEIRVTELASNKLDTCTEQVPNKLVACVKVGRWKPSITTAIQSRLSPPTR